MYLKISHCTVLCLALIIGGQKPPAQRPSLTQSQQQAFLNQRTWGTMDKTFASWGSFLYVLRDVLVCTKNESVAKTELTTVFPDFYQPTWREYWDAMARQTKSSWHYDPSTDNWVFGEPSPPLPFSINMAEKWTSYDAGLYVKYKPPTAPVGMDIYMLGTYSANSKEAPEMYRKVRDALALRFASNFKKDVSVTDMQIVKVDGVEALYFQSTTPHRKGAVWRQWALVKDGKGFVIVSALDEADSALFNDVEAMVKSFQAK